MGKRKVTLQQQAHNVSSDGLAYTTNRSGARLCEAFQKGECPGRNGWCAADSAYSHQCARCLSQEHGAHSPQECTKAPKASSSYLKGQGKSKGKKGKGKGKYKQY